MKAPSASRETKWVIAGLLAWWGLWAAAVVLRGAQAQADVDLAPWQHPLRALPWAEQRRAVSVREAMLELENLRSADGVWPTPTVAAASGVEAFAASGWTWALLRDGVVTTYVGVPQDEAALRWLVLFIEPVSRGVVAPPQDDEHHTLFDGTAIHASSWTQPNHGPRPTSALAFPASGGWTQQVAQETGPSW